MRKLLLNAVCTATLVVSTDGVSEETVRSHPEKLAFIMMIHHVSNPKCELFKFSLNTIIKLARQADQLAFPSLQENLPRGLEMTIFDEIYPFVVEANKRENYNFVIALAGALGKRGFSIIKLQNLLDDLCCASNGWI